MRRHSDLKLFRLFGPPFTALVSVSKSQPTQVRSPRIDTGTSIPRKSAA